MIKENANQPHTSPTPSEASVSQRLEGVRKAARENKDTKFTALLHHMTVDLLRGSSPISDCKSPVTAPPPPTGCVICKSGAIVCAKGFEPKNSIPK